MKPVAIDRGDDGVDYGDDDDDDDDDDIILVSSTRQKWEQLHGINLHSLGSTSRNKGSSDNDGFQSNNRIHNHNQEDEDEDEDDEILVVAVPPTPPKHDKLNKKNDEHGSSGHKRTWIYQRIRNSFFGLALVDNNNKIFSEYARNIGNPWMVVLLFVATALSLGVKKRTRRTKQNRPTSTIIAPSNLKKTENHGKGKSAGAENVAKGDPGNVDKKEDTSRNKTKTADLAGEKSTDDVLLSSKESKSPRGGKKKQKQNGKEPPETQRILLPASPSPPPSPLSLSLALSKKTDACENTTATTIVATKQQRDEKLQMARRLAEDIRLVRDVLVEHSLDPSMAAQLAVSMQASQSVIESQRELSYATTMIDSHERRLDRQLSERQHRESLEAARYDPNWREKLRSVRDECYYWNLASGGFSRLWWEVLWIQQMARGVLPVWQYYYSNAHRWNGVGTTTVHTDAALGATDPWSGLVASFLKDTIASILAQVCDCRPHASIGPSEATAGATTSLADHSTMTSWAMPFIASAAFSLHNTGTLQELVEQWSCYGYCIASASMGLMLTIVLHQGLRILSMPSSLHHAINLLSMALFYGPHRTLALGISSISRMLMVLPAFDSSTSFDHHTDDILDLGGPPAGGNNQRAMLACSLLLLSLWVGLPLTSWIRTPALCRRVESRVAGADPIDFERTLQAGTVQLRRWQWEQMAARYLLLSIYSALILWENIQNTTAIGSYA